MADGLRETDLFPPLADFLRREGYSVHAEVLGADVAARRGEELLLVELKLRLNLDALLQAAGRQGMADKTYVAVPCRGGRRSAKWGVLKDILRRLGLGLFFVRFAPPLPPQVEEVLAAEDSRCIKNLRKKRKLRASLVREMEGRPANFNTGGSVKQKLVTAYFVDCLRVALLLREHEKRPGGLLARGREIRLGAGAGKSGRGLSPRKLRGLGAPQNCRAILYDNHRGWFSHLGPGRYALSPAGKEALREYRDVVESLARTGGRTRN
jgi:hypothetical protein